MPAAAPEDRRRAVINLFDGFIIASKSQSVRCESSREKVYGRKFMVLPDSEFGALPAERSAVSFKLGILVSSL